MHITRLLEQIRGIAQAGLAYSKLHYDLDRYKQLHELINQVASEVMGLTKEQIEKIYPLEPGYRTPRTEIRGAIFDSEGRVLLCRESADGLWSLPGGWCDTGLTPSENMLKEIHEETGYQARIVKLIALYDHDRHGHLISTGHVYKIFFLCEITGGVASGSFETEACEYFSLDALPPLSTSRITEHQVRRCYEHFRNPELPTEFD